MLRSSAFAAALLFAATIASAQSLGTFRWQTQPYCNVLTLTVTQQGGLYKLDGFDDQCGAATKAPVSGTAVPNADGTLQFGLSIVTSPGGAAAHIAVPINVATLGGPWKDAAGNGGTFAFNARTGGNPRPLPVGTPAIPPAIALRTDGGFVATGAEDVGTIPASGPGARSMWYPGKGAFRAGVVDAAQWDNGNIGYYSTAFGLDSQASGQASVAMGQSAVASGSASVALGIGTEASRAAAVALGQSTKASGDWGLAAGFGSRAGGAASTAIGMGAIADGAFSVALGGGNMPGMAVQAIGANSVALGTGLDATGPSSVVLGSRASTTLGGRGSFVFGDDSTTNTIQAFSANEFKVRAAGGTSIFSNSTLTTGVRLPTGASAWSSLSDVNSKEHFRDLDDDDVLAKIARMPVREWNYKAQHAGIRHVGPTAQDFHSAFGLGEDPLRISTIDADGIALRAIQALEARTRSMVVANESLARENRQLKASLEAVQARLAAMEPRPR